MTGCDIMTNIYAMKVSYQSGLPCASPHSINPICPLNDGQKEEINGRTVLD